MDLEKYRVLLDVIQKGSLSRVAETSHYTTSGISRMMASVEEEQGFPLLIRHHDGVRPTAACEMLLPYLQELLHQEAIFHQVAASISGLETGSIQVGVAYSSYYRPLADLAEAFTKDHPQVKFHFVSGYSSDLLEKLQRHELDLCLISNRKGDHKWRPLGEEELVAWLPAGHPLAKEKSFSLSSFETEPYIDIYQDRDIDNARIFKKYRIRPQVTMAAEDSFAVYKMVEAGLGGSLNHRSNCADWKGAVTVLPLEPAIAIPVGIAYLGDATPLCQAFLETFDDIIR